MMIWPFLMVMMNETVLVDGHDADDRHDMVVVDFSSGADVAR